MKAVAHITGGGLTENIPRSIPDNYSVKLNRSSWTEPGIFLRIKDAAGLPDEEMDRTFNRGIGCVVVVGSENAKKAIEVLEKSGETVYRIGEILERSDDGRVIINM